MRVLISPQEFKGTLSAVEAAHAIAGALSATFPDWQLDLLPMADGGPGTTQALLAALGGEEQHAAAHDPLMRPIDAAWGRLSKGVAVVECAAASGLWRLQLSELDPRAASSFGTGELIKAALAAGCRDLIVGLGGSATNDGGAGLAQALGFRLEDAQGRSLPPGGAALRQLARIDASGVDGALRSAHFVGATDVTNPLCGPEGASAVYGPQKGADAAAVAELDEALRHYAGIIARDLDIDVAARAGAGAAGGLGAALIACLGAELRPGAQIVGQAADLEGRIRLADLVITGEGRLDGQTAFGKAPQYIAGLAKAAGKPVVCLAALLGEGHEAVGPLFAVVEAFGDASQPLPTSDAAAAQLADAAVSAVRTLMSRGVFGVV